MNDEERDPEDQIHEGVMFFLSRPSGSAGSEGTGPREVTAGNGARPRGGAQGRGTGIGMAAERPGGYAARKLRNLRTRSAMGGWVLKS